MVLNEATITFVIPSIMLDSISFSAPSQLSATSAVTPTIIGIMLVAIPLKVAIARLCREPNKTTNGFILVIITVKPMPIVAAKPIANDCPNGIKVPRVLLKSDSPSAKVLTKNPKVPPSFSVNIFVISNPTLPSLLRATTNPPACLAAELP